MAPLAPRETEPGPDAPRAGAATTTPQPLRRPHRNRPTTRPGLPLAPPAPVAAAVARPGVRAQESLLQDFYTTAVPGALPSPSPASIWITPPSTSPRFTHFYITSMLSYMLTSSPDLLRARQVRPFVFCARVSNQNVANILVVRGHLEFHRQRFCIHGSAERAAFMASALKVEEGVITGQPLPTPLEVNATAERTAQCRFAGSNLRKSCSRGEGIMGRIPVGTRPYEELFPTLQHVAGVQVNASPLGSVSSQFSAHVSQDTKPYLQAALSPSLPQQPTPRRKPPTPLNHPGCYRCLSRDHLVRDCRDPICCRLCHCSGHRGYSCPMVLPREQTPHPRGRRPTIPVPATRVPLTAVPFSPRSSPPPSTTPTPPPTPLNLPPFTTAFDPLHMLASSSAGPSVGQQVQRRPSTAASDDDGPFFLGDLFREPVDTGKKVARAPPRPTCNIPKARDIRMVGSTSPRGHSRPGSPAVPTRGHPMPASPPRAAAPLARDAATAGPADSVAGSDPDAGEGAPEGSDRTPSEHNEDEDASVDSDEGPDYVETWVNEGNWERAARYAYVEVEPADVVANPAPLLHAAFLAAAPDLRFQILPSAHGVALLHFGCPAARELALLIEPLYIRGVTFRLRRLEETDDRFVRESEWLADVVCWNYPEEHWDADKIREVYFCVGQVMEIDYFCIPGFERSYLRFVIAVHAPRIPSRIAVHPPSGRGILLGQEGVAFWPRAQQYDDDGNWIPYFGPAPPPPPADDMYQGARPLPPPPRRFGPNPPPPPPAPEQAPPPPPPLHPAAFQGAAILCLGYINPFPLPRLPTLPIMLHLPTNPTIPGSTCFAQPTLLLTWRAPPMPDTIQPAAPPPSPVSVRGHGSPPAMPPRPNSGRARGSPPLTRAATRASARAALPRLGTRASNRLAAKDDGMFIDATAKASQLKALQNSLASCSKVVQLHVAQRKLMKKSKKPIHTVDLIKLSNAVGLGKETAVALDRALDITKATTLKLDAALARSDV